MGKFYVESGELRQVVESDRPILAVCRALSLVDPELELSPVITVNERGFIRDRPYRQHYGSDLVLETGTLLALLSEHEF